jgi:hypothetical protein
VKRRLRVFSGIVENVSELADEINKWLDAESVTDFEIVQTQSAACDGIASANTVTITIIYIGRESS